MCSADPNDPSDTDEQLSPQLRDAMRLAAGEAHESTVALRDAVCGYVEDGRRRGVPLEEMVQALKRLVARLRHAAAIPLAPDGPDVLIEQLVAWCMEFGTA